MNKFLAVLALVSIAGCSQEGSITANGRAHEVGEVKVPTHQVAVLPLARRTERLNAPGGFADLPDRGELLAYPVPHAPKRDGAYTWNRVDLSEEHAFQAIVGKKMRVRAPSGEVLEIVYDRHEEHPSGDWSWIGHLPGQSGAQTILTFGASGVFGSIGQMGNRSLRVTTKNNAAWLVETDPRMLASIASAGANPRNPDHLAVPKMRRQSASSQATQASLQSTTTTTTLAIAPTTVDLVIGYSAGFVNEYGSTSAAQTRLNNMVAVANQGLVNSQVNARIRLVRTLQVSYTDNTTNESALEQLTGYDSSAQEYTTPNSAFNALRAAREQYGADLVTLVRAFRDPEQDGCGIAWLIGGGRSGVSDGDGQDYFGYSVVSDGEDINEQDGERYFCREETLIHELGHNMGSQHDRESARGENGQMESDEYGAFTYSFGLKTTAAAGNFYTIMAYGDSGQTDFRVFSNPRITFCGGRACGTTTYEDNARSLGQIAPRVAGFRAARVAAGSAETDVDGDGKSDLLWSRPSTSHFVYWLMDGSDTRIGRSFAVSSAWTAIGTGDLDGNRRTDVVWKNNTTGEIRVWMGNGFSYSIASVGNRAGWTLVGTGDVNGDGRSDLLWSRKSTGQFVHWIMNGADVVIGKSFLVSSSWRAVGVGDLNNDQHADVIWKNDTNGGHIYVWSGTGSGYRVSSSIGARIGWTLTGVSDVNGDSKDDLIWSKSGWLVHWIMDGADVVIGKSFTLNPEWRALGTADFDGNKRADVVFKNDYNGGHIYMWLGSGSSYTASSSVGRRLGWTIVPFE